MKRITFQLILAALIGLAALFGYAGDYDQAQWLTGIVLGAVAVQAPLAVSGRARRIILCQGGAVCIGRWDRTVGFVAQWQCRRCGTIYRRRLGVNGSSEVWERCSR